MTEIRSARMPLGDTTPVTRLILLLAFSPLPLLSVMLNDCQSNLTLNLFLSTS